jgi:hypothetical protein
VRHTRVAHPSAADFDTIGIPTCSATLSGTRNLPPAAHAIHLPLVLLNQADRQGLAARLLGHGAGVGAECGDTRGRDGGRRRHGARHPVARTTHRESPHTCRLVLLG